MEYIKYLKECWFNDIEIQTKLKEREIMKQLYLKEKKEPRYITTTTYERVRKRTTKSVDGWLTGRR